MNRKVLAAIAAVLLAAAGTVVLTLYVRSAEDRALAGERAVDVLVVTEAIARGTSAEDITAVRLEKVPAKVQSQGSVTNLDELEGKVTAVELLPGEQVVAKRFADPAALLAQSTVDVPAGLQEVTVSLSPDRAVGGNLRPGSTVGVLVSFANHPEGAEGGTTHLLLHKVLVTRFQGEPATTQADQEESGGPAPAPGGSFLVTLAVDANAAERIVFGAEHGSLWLTAEPEAATEEGTRIETMESIYR